ncbi:hypothetical protein WN944_017580 [Citrus x changshan-huyou]|uniref:Myb-like domain-containing protein n=1 Tax=Citrus x changshan-huyou TaxID=2935761 RepID=A0AAP0QPM5_9ROSI
MLRSYERYLFLCLDFQEDDLIIEPVGKQGNGKWSDIAKHLPGRIGKQCRERWAEIKASAREEHAFAFSLGCRTENSVKNHWNCSISKKIIQSACVSDLYKFRHGSRKWEL